MAVLTSSFKRDREIARKKILFKIFDNYQLLGSIKTFCSCSVKFYLAIKFDKSMVEACCLDENF